MLGETRAEAIEATERQQRNSFWSRMTVYGAVALALTGLYDPLKDIYVRYANPDIGQEPVAVALEQQRLTEKNLDCLREAQQFKVSLAGEMEVRLLACASGDVQVVVYPKDAPAKQRWITTKGVGGYAAAGAADWLVGRALAQIAATPAPGTTAQVAIQNVCQGWQDSARKSKLVRITNEGGKCWKEVVNVFTGRVEYREETVCTATCTG